jgi:uncharacterized membrane protein YqhA
VRRMFEHLFKLRYLTLVIVILAVGHAVAFLVMGTLAAFKGYGHVIAAIQGVQSARPGLDLLHSLDFMFVSMVLIVLALGIAKLFLMHPSDELTVDLPLWLRIDSISQLKILLWETVLTTLMIIALSDLSAGLFTKLDWTVLLTPAAILVLALSLYLIKKE